MGADSTERGAVAEELVRWLRRQPGVRVVHVEEVAAEDPLVEAPRLEAYVVRAPADERKSALQENVWKTVFDDTFRREEQEGSMASAGIWTSSYTGRPIESDELTEWLTATAVRVRELRPRRVLEIGCGDGQLLMQIAPYCEHYHGMDFSAAALALAERRVASSRLPHVSLSQSSANDLEDLDAGAFDTVVINSVAQYFPSLEYLLEVLKKARRVLTTGGSIFLGDVRNLRWAKMQYVSLELHHAVGDVPIGEVALGLRRRGEAEKELLVDPSICYGLVELLDLASARVHLKTGRRHNELVCFRYDLTLKAADAGARCSASTTWTDWRSIAAVDAPGSSSREGLAALRAKLVALPLLQPGLAVRGIPNARLVGLARALERLRDSPTHASTLRELRSDGDASDGVEPQDLFDLAEELGFRLELGASRLAHECDALFDREGAELVETVFGAGERRPLDECATEPTNRGRARFGKRLAGDLAEESPRLAARSVVIVVDRISRHADGSLDRGALADEI